MGGEEIQWIRARRVKIRMHLVLGRRDTRTSSAVERSQVEVRILAPRKPKRSVIRRYSRVCSHLIPSCFVLDPSSSLADLRPEAALSRPSMSVATTMLPSEAYLYTQSRL